MRCFQGALSLADIGLSLKSNQYDQVYLIHSPNAHSAQFHFVLQNFGVFKLQLGFDHFQLKYFLLFTDIYVCIPIQAICEVLPKDRNPSVDLLNLFNYANKKMDDELKESSAGEMNQVPLAGVRILFTSTLFVCLFAVSNHFTVVFLLIYHTNFYLLHIFESFCNTLYLEVIFLNIIFLS